MKRLLAGALRVVLRSDVLTAILEKTLGWPVDYARIVRRELVHVRREKTSPELSFICSKIPDLTVRSGPFRGMRYPKAAAVGSALVPKLLGTYEAELHRVIEEICCNNYCCVIDVGCAEGYYAVGLALRLTNAMVFAFDTDPEAIRLCVSMAELNYVSERLLTGGFCTASTLSQLPLGDRSLVVCDCEGFESKLFGEDAVKSLTRHDILIELHDFLEPGVSALIRDRFSKTHTIESFMSVSDHDKIKLYHPLELDGVSSEIREILLAERRPCLMEWFFLKAKQSGLKK